MERGRGAAAGPSGREGDGHEGGGGGGETPGSPAAHSREIERVVHPTVVVEEAGALLSQSPPSDSHRYARVVSLSASRPTEARLPSMSKPRAAATTLEKQPALNASAAAIVAARGAGPRRRAPTPSNCAARIACSRVSIACGPSGHGILYALKAVRSRDAAARSSVARVAAAQNTCAVSEACVPNKHTPECVR